MSFFTTQVRYIVENEAYAHNISTDKSPSELCYLCADYVLSESFPVWEGATTTSVKAAILRHYYVREIGLETVELWKHFLSTRLSEIMPKYTDYATSLIGNLSPAWSEVRIEERDRKGNDKTTSSSSENSSSSGTSTSTSSSENKTVGNNTTTGSTTGHTDSTDTGTNNKTGFHSDTPQNGLSSVAAGTYMSDATVDTGSHNNAIVSNDNGSSSTQTDIDQTSTGTGSSRAETSANGNRGTTGAATKDYGEKETVTVKGRTNAIQHNAEYHKIYMTVIQMIIADCADLFMGIL